MVRTQLFNLNVNKSCGPDKVHPRMLLELADNIAGPIALLLNNDHRAGNFTERLEARLRVADS